MILGITPVDAAFEMMGLHEAQALMRFIFVETLGGKVIFALGFILGLARGLERGNFKGVMVFVVAFFGVWFLGVQPRATVVAPVSAMERNGYQGLSAAELIKKGGYDAVVVNPVFFAVSRGVDALVTGVAAVVDRMGKGGGARGYLASPFLAVKVSLITRAIIGRGITDRALSDAAARFYQQDYWKAVRGLDVETVGLWPGDKRVVAVYKEDARARWGVLRDALYGCVNQEKIFDRMFERFYGAVIDKDAVVQALLEQEMRLRPQAYTRFAYGAPQQVVVEAGAPGVLDAFAWVIVRFYPAAQGLCLLCLWVALPVVMVAALLCRAAGALALWLGLLLAVKGWTVLWVLAAKAAGVLFLLPAMPGSTALWLSPVVNVITATAVLVLPLAGLGVFLLVLNRCHSTRGQA